MKNSMRFTYLLAGIALLLSTSCTSSFSELQGARLVGEGKMELTPYYTTVSATSDGDTEGLQNQVGLNGAIGLGPKFDLRLRVENIWAKETGFGDGYIIVGAGPKLSLIENVLSAYLPVGRALGEGTSESWEVQPTLLLTWPAVEEKLDINLTPKYIFNLCEDCDDFVAVNLGLAISGHLSNWAIRPEYGLLFNPGESGHVSQFSIGLSKIFGK